MMDYMTTAQEKDYLLSLRIRSPRAKKRALREDREKQLLGLERELSTISTLQHNMGYVPLDPPIMRGWKRTFVLRADVAAGTKAAFYQGTTIPGTPSIIAGDAAGDTGAAPFQGRCN